MAMSQGYGMAMPMDYGYGYGLLLWLKDYGLGVRGYWLGAMA